MRRAPKRPNERAKIDENEPRVNDRIRVPRVLVIDEDGNRLGEFMTRDAIQMAIDRGFDLVEVAPEARPPVCRITDFGRLKYDRKKKASAARKNQVQVVLKEVKLRPKTDDHDLKVKVSHIRRFLEEGNKVKITVRFRGRELAHREIGEDQCARVAQAVTDLGAVETAPRMEGKQMFMILAPTKRPVRKRSGEGEEPLPDLPDDDDLTDEPFTDEQPAEPAEAGVED